MDTLQGTQASHTELDQLLQMLLGSTREELWRLWEPQDEARFVQQLSSALADAVRAAEHTPSFRNAIAPVITDGVMDTARRQPQKVGDALAPALGPAIRSMVRLAMDDINERIESGVRQTFSMDGLRWRWQAFRSGVPFGDVVLQHTRQYRVEHVMLIHRSSGTLLADVSRPTYQGKDAAVVASMLSAVGHFVADAFESEPAEDADQEPNRHRQFEVGSLVVKVEVLGELVLAAVIRGAPTTEVSNTLIGTLELLQSVVGEAAGNFDGDIGPFDAIDHLLLDCLIEQKLAQGKMAKPEPKAGNPLRYLGIGLLVASGLLLSWDSHRRSQAFAEFRQLLEAQPGLMVTKVERENLVGRPTYRLTGMLDPFGEHPSELPREHLFDLVWDLRSYLSLDPEITARRAAATLQPADGVELNVRSSTLELSGIATADWLARVRGSSIPGILHLDTSRLFLL